MSEPQLKNTHQENATSPTEEEIIRGDQVESPSVTATAPPASTSPPPPTATAAGNVGPTNNDQQQPPLTGPVKTLKDAFPDLDVEVIETILDSQGGNLDATFEVLLGMSDPTYKPEPETIQQQSVGMDQLRQDEEYARRLAREGDAHYPQNNTAATNENQQPLFNFQEELPIIKEKVIEAGTAAKNKIMNLYNQFMAGPADSSSSSGNNRGGQQQDGLLETSIRNLSLSDNNYQQQPRQQPRQPPRPNNQSNQGSLDLYEWDGQPPANNNNRNPLNQQRRENNITTSATSTPTAQMLSDEEFARQLAREDAEAAETAAAIAAVNKSEHNSPVVNNTRAVADDELVDDEEVTFSAINDKSSDTTTSAKPSGYTINDDDDLDDLFDTHDEEESKPSSTTAAAVKK